ncbi:MAG TPA: hypothetical protein VF808_01135 [Ktedonobacterales bacterium]
MRQISSRRREERTRGRLDDADARIALAPRPDSQSLQRPTASTDFTAQVMARLTAPVPPLDSSIMRARKARARAGVFARVYFAVLLIAAIVVTILAIIAPWTLETVIVGLLGAFVAILAGVALIARATGGFVTGLGVLYAAMLTLLTPSILMLAHRTRRRRSRPPQ